MNSGYKNIAFCVVALAAFALLLSSCAPYQAHKGTAYFKQRGKASWYGPGFAGRKTANGERFNPSQLTAAHRELPFNTTVKVTNLDNGKSVVVRINDRGPYAGRRVIDLSKAAARKIDLIGSGVAMVEIETLTPGMKDKVPEGAEAEADAKQAQGVLLASRGRVTKNGVEHLIQLENAKGTSLPGELEEASEEEAPAPEPAPIRPAANKYRRAEAGSSSIEDRFVVTSSPSRGSGPTGRRAEKSPPSAPREKTYSVDDDAF